MVNTIYGESYSCTSCGGSHNYVGINDNTVVREFSYNYYIPKPNKCSWAEEDRFCVLTNWNDFVATPEFYIEKAFQKRSADISNYTRVKP